MYNDSKKHTHGRGTVYDNNEGMCQQDCPPGKGLRGRSCGQLSWHISQSTILSLALFTILTRIVRINVLCFYLSLGVYIYTKQFRFKMKLYVCQEPLIGTIISPNFASRMKNVVGKMYELDNNRCGIYTYWIRREYVLMKRMNEQHKQISQINYFNLEKLIYA